MQPLCNKICGIINCLMTTFDFWRILNEVKKHKVTVMRCVGQLTLLSSFAALTLLIGLGLWRDRGPSTAMFLAMSEQRANSTTAWDIVVSNIDGSNRQVVVATEAWERVPYWSDDGTWLAYSRIFAFRSSVWGYNFETQQNYPIVSEFYDVYSPTIAPDNDRIVAEATPNAIGTLFVVNTKTGAVQQLTDDLQGGVRPMWTSDGKAVVYNVVDKIYRVDVDNRSLQELLAAEVGFGVDIAPDDTWIVFWWLKDGKHNLTRVDLATGAITTLSAPQTASSRPAISPDGRWIAYSNNGAIYRVASDGGPHERIIAEDGVEFDAPTWSPVYDVDYDWLPATLASAAAMIISLMVVVLWKGKRG